MFSSWLNNFTIYCDNLSVYYVFTILLSVLAVFLTWWFQDARLQRQGDINNGTGIEDDKEPGDMDSGSILTQIKMTRQKAIVEQLSAGLTEEQLQQEKEMERKQLEAIFLLLKEQEDKFQVNSMEEVEDQLKLYRR